MSVHRYYAVVRGAESAGSGTARQVAKGKNGRCIRVAGAKAVKCPARYLKGLHREKCRYLPAERLAARMFYDYPSLRQWLCRVRGNLLAETLAGVIVGQRQVPCDFRSFIAAIAALIKGRELPAEL